MDEKHAFDRVFRHLANPMDVDDGTLFEGEKSDEFIVLAFDDGIDRDSLLPRRVLLVSENDDHPVLKKLKKLLGEIGITVEENQNRYCG